MRRLVAPAAVIAFCLAGCPDWDSFTRGSPDAGTAPSDGGAAVDGNAGVPDATPEAGITPVVAIEAPLRNDDAQVDLTAEGTTDWLERHDARGAGNRCSACARSLDLQIDDDPADDYADDPRTFRWSNGSPTATGTMRGGVLTLGTGNQIVLRAAITASAPARQVLRMYVTTFFVGASIRAVLDGATDATIALPEQIEGQRYVIRIPFSGKVGTSLVVTFTLTSIHPAGANDFPNIAFSAATLAPDP